jgi:hypothetical protein
MYNLQEAYLDVYYDLDEAKEDEKLTPLQKIRKRNNAYSIPGEPAGQQTSNRRAERSSTRGVKKEKGAKSAFGTMKHVGGPYTEEVDLYDVILDYLLDEGYTDTIEGAEAIMVSMSEEWRESIVEAEVFYRGGKPEQNLLDKQEKVGQGNWNDPKVRKRFADLGNVHSDMVNPEKEKFRATVNRQRDLAVQRRGSNP